MGIPSYNLGFSGITDVFPSLFSELFSDNSPGFSPAPGNWFSWVPVTSGPWDTMLLSVPPIGLLSVISVSLSTSR